MITLRQLRYFEALARVRHFGRAADICAITQPALSQQVKELEETLGQKLVERGRGAIRLTPMGREIAERARKVLADVRDMEDHARSLRAPLSGRLALGVIPSIAPYLLPALLPLLRHEYPDLELELHEAQTDVILEELADGRLDLLLLALPIEGAHLQSLPLFEDPFLLAVPDGMELPRPAPCLPELMAGHRLLLLEEGHCLRDQALAVCALRERERIDTFGASTLSTIVQMVAAGLGITLLPEMAAAVEGRTEGVELLRIAPPEPSRTVGLAWRRASPLEDDYRAFGEVVHRAQAGLAVLRK